MNLWDSQKDQVSRSSIGHSLVVAFSKQFVRQSLFVSTVVLGTIMVACVETTTDPSQLEFETSVQVLGDANIASNQNLLRSFTTEGKSTKVIDTFGGPHEVYDPLQDADVRAAYERLFEDGTKIVRRNTIGTESSDEAIVFFARDAYYKTIMAGGCNQLWTADCSTTYYFKPLIKVSGRPSGNYEECINSGQENCRWKNITTRQITPSSHCAIQKGNAWYSHESTYSCPISHTVKSVGCYAEPKKKRNLNESMEWFFQSDCRQWAADK